MTYRIKREDLQRRVDYLNRILQRPATTEHAYTPDDDGNYTHARNENGYSALFIDRYAPGGNPYQYKLNQLSRHRGTGESPITNYRMTIREFYAYLNGMIDAVEMIQREHGLDLGA